MRKILQQTAKDLGPRGKDHEFGAGLVDAYQAIMAAQPNATAGQAAPQPKGSGAVAEWLQTSSRRAGTPALRLSGSKPCFPAALRACCATGV